MFRTLKYRSQPKLLYKRPAAAVQKKSRAISGVLLKVIIHQGLLSPAGSSDTTRKPDADHTWMQKHPRFPIRSCFGRGLPGQRVTPLPVSSYLTVSPLLLAKRSSFLWHFPPVTRSCNYQPTCPVKPRLSSRFRRNRRSLTQLFFCKAAADFRVIRQTIIVKSACSINLQPVLQDKVIFRTVCRLQVFQLS